MSVIQESAGDDGSPRRDKEGEETVGGKAGDKDRTQFDHSPREERDSSGRGQSALGKTRTARIKNQQEAMLAKLANLKKLQEAHRTGKPKTGNRKDSSEGAYPSG